MPCPHSKPRTSPVYLSASNSVQSGTVLPPANRVFKTSGATALASWRDGLAALAAGLGMFLAALDISVNVALPSIRSVLETDLQTVQWVIVVFIATRAG